jgi:hypothetical protein
LHAVNPTIAAALISGGVGAVGVVGTAVTAWIGSRNSRKATGQAVAAGAANTRATLAAAREDRLWEKRCAVYEQELRELLYRQSKRYNDLRGYRWDEASEQQLKEFYNAYEPPGFFESRARMAAYASDVVLAASNTAGKAHGEVRAACLQLEELREQIRTAQLNGTPQSAPSGETMMNANRKINDAREAAETADDVVIMIIREELRSRPEAATEPPAALPAVRPGFWQRRKAVDD